MANVLSIEDVVDLGIEKEKARRDFYAHVADTFQDPEMKTLFSQLRDWENAHVNRFTKIRESLRGRASKESYPGEMEAYMQSLVDDRFYSEVSPATFGEHVESPLDAIRYGIAFEKDAILFFMEMARYVQADTKDTIMELMEEERSHVIHLIKLRKKMGGGPTE
ncbi:ferritin family protein [bacterium]|nr:ferritin family protein [bacterium]